MKFLRAVTWIAICGGLGLTSARASAADYWVTTAGKDDAAAGSSTAPWLTLQFAADHVKAGDTVHVKNGSYVGFDLRTGGTAASPVKFVGEGDAVMITSRNARTPDGINVEGADYVTIENFTINGMPRTGARCALSAFVTFRKIKADANHDWGILTGCCTDTILEDNVTTGSLVQHGIYFSNSGDRPIIRRNVIHGNVGAGLHMNGDITVDCSPKLTTDGIIDHAVIEDNVIYDNGSGSGINCAGVQNSIIRNNLLYGNHGSGISLYQGEAPEGAKNNLVVNNTILMAADGRWALNVNQASTGNKIRNNIFFTLHPSRGSIVITADSLTGFDSDYNLLTPRMSPDGDPTTLDLAGWQALGYDEHGFAGTPDAVFVDATSDFHLEAGSPAIDKGEAASAPPTDLTGAARPAGSAPDLGAYEYGATAPTDGGVLPDAATDAAGADGAIADATGSDTATPVDGGSDVDAAGDGGGDSSSGCGCRTSGTTREGAGSFAAALGLLLTGFRLASRSRGSRRSTPSSSARCR